MFAFLVVFYAVLRMFATAEPTPRYFIIAPNVIRVDVDETILVNVVETPEGVEIPVTLYLDLAGSNERISNTTVRVTKGAPEKVTLRVDREQLPEQADSQKFINLVVSANAAQLQFQDRRPILLSYRAGFVFIQTDKPVYTPSQRVDMRIVGLDQDMVPANHKLRVDIANPDHIIVRRYNEEPDRGFLTLNYHFPPNPVFGNWTVTAYYGHQFKANTSVQFEVKEYVLPKFHVEVDTEEKYIVPETRNLVSFVTARYTFGEPVVGNVFVRYGVFGDDGSWKTLQEKEDQLDDHGLSVTDLDMDQVTVEDWAVTLMGKTLVIQAFVTDRATGETINANNTMVIFNRTPYQFNWDLTQRYFKRGLSFAVKATVQYMSGLPAVGIDVAVSATAGLTTGEQVRLEGRQVDGNQEPTNKVSGAQGEVDFRLDVPEDANSVTIRLETRDPALVAANTHSTFTVDPQQSDTDEYLHVRIPSGDVRQTQQIGRPSSIEVQLTDSDSVHEGLSYFVIAGGKIVRTGIKQRQLVNQNTFLGFDITHDMAPSSRVVAYYIREDGKVVADALYFQVEEVCENQIGLAFRGLENVGGTFETDGNDQNVELQVSARADTTIGLLAVDEAVFALRNYHRLTQKKVFERKAGYDLGCGPGGGETTAAIFRDAGVTVLTNAELNVASREALGCPSGAGRVRRSLSDDEREEILSRYEGSDREYCEKGMRQLADPDEEITCATRAKQLARRKRIAQDSSEIAAFFDCCLEAKSLSKGRSGAGDQGSVNLENIMVRSNFKESWMFIDKETDENGQALHQATLPDSVTTWVIEAVGVSRHYDMCVADPVKLQVRKPFFLDLSMPYSVQRYEQIEIIASVFNYADNNLQVTVYLKGAEGVCSEAQPGSYSEGITVNVTPKKPTSVSFVIVPLEVRKLPIEVAAVTNSGGEYRDAIRKDLTVRPEGYERKDIVSITLDPENIRKSSMTTKRAEKGPTFNYTQFWGKEGESSQYNVIRYEVNGGAIPGTSKVHFSLVGNVMGDVIDTVIGGLEKLLRIPNGCGEQTMIGFAPNVYIYKYLKYTDQFTTHLEISSEGYIRGGIERELTFRRPTGSFAVFGKDPGSTWLTSFVNKVMCQAKEFAFVDDSITCKAMEWLVTQTKREDGSFYEVSRVIHREMTGGVQGDVSMTAFVLISLLECDCNSVQGEKENSVADATSFLEHHLPSLARPYAIAITAYALALANSNMAGNATRMLKEIALYDGDSDSRRWGSDDSSFDANTKPYWYSRRPKAIEVETTSYALLALLEMDEIPYTHAIVNWLTNQENYNGGFVSTQDTVVALQALSEYAIRAPQNDIDMECRVTCPETGFKGEYLLGPDNALIRQHGNIGIPELRPELLVYFDTEGSGTGQLKFESTLYLPEPDSDTCDFELIANYEADGDDEKHFLYDVSVRYLRGEATGMSIVDVGLFTGDKPAEQNLKLVKETYGERIQRYEVTDRSVVFYFEEIPMAESTRLTFQAERLFNVGKAQPVSVRVYDYYNPTVECVKFISPGDGSGLLNTLCEGDTCICAEGKCGRNPYFEKRDFDVYEMKQKACTTTSHFAYEVRVDSVGEKESFQYFNMTILAPLKPGLDKVHGGERRTFWKSKNCDNPDIKLGSNYLVIGSGGLQTKNNAGNPYFKYIIDERMSFYVWPTDAMTRKPRGESDSKKKQARIWRNILAKLVELKRDLIEGDGCPT